jgi:hypothetical protein
MSERRSRPGIFFLYHFALYTPQIFYGVSAGETSLFGPAEVATSHAMTAHEYYKRREGTGSTPYLAGKSPTVD